MENLALTLDNDAAHFLPGETISGVAVWEQSENPQSAEIRLFWFTAGIGTRDVTLVDTFRFEQPRISDQQRFSLTLPDAPYSFSGALISLMWSLELVLNPGEKTQRLDITLSPFEQPIVLQKIEEDKSAKGFQFHAGS